MNLKVKERIEQRSTKLDKLTDAFIAEAITVEQFKESLAAIMREFDESMLANYGTRMASGSVGGDSEYIYTGDDDDDAG